MRKFEWIEILVVSIISFSLLSGCRSGNESGHPDAGKLENAFTDGSGIYKINSSIHTDGEIDGFTTFYFSPTQGLTDPESMILADDAVKLVTNSTDGTVNMAEEGNSISYGGFVLDKRNIDSFSEVFVSVRFLTQTSVELSVSAVRKTGEYLKCEYTGKCRRWPEAEPAADVILTDVIMAKCLGKVGTKGEEDIYNYYILLTDADYTLSGNQMTVNEAGVVVCLDLYSVMVDPPHKLVIPTGDFVLGDSSQDHTYGIQYSCAGIYNDSGVQTSVQELDGTVSVERSGDGTLKITAYYLDAKQERVKVEYVGDDFYSVDTGSNFSNPQIGHDVVLDGFSATALYYGNLFQSATGMMLINIFDENYQMYDKEGYCVSLVVFSDLFGNPKDARLIPGTYSVSKSMAHSTWLPAMEVNYYGIPMVLGSYAHFLESGENENAGKYSYAETGSVTIEEAGEGFKVTFDFVSNDGYVIRGSYTGNIPVVDNSSDTSDDDGTSTLEKDYDLDLSIWDCAYVAPTDKVWVKGMGYFDIDGEPLKNLHPSYPAPFGIQYVYLGLQSDDRDGDRVRLELIVNDGAEQFLAPGTYECTEERYPEYFVPGSMMKGIALEGDIGVSSSFLHYTDGWGKMDQHAIFYGGAVTITKAEGGDNWFTFDIDGICVREHHVRGSWTGPVYLFKGTDPVTEWHQEEPASVRMSVSGDAIEKAAALCGHRNPTLDGVKVSLK